MRMQCKQSRGAGNCCHIVSGISPRGITQEWRVRSKGVRVSGEDVSDSGTVTPFIS